MSILTQKTIKNKIHLSGIGIHTGVTANLNIYPAHINTGIVFKRSDLKKIIAFTQIIKMLVIQLCVQLYRMNLEQRYQP